MEAVSLCDEHRLQSVLQEYGAVCCRSHLFGFMGFLAAANIGLMQ
jgi:hypothetical protein